MKRIIQFTSALLLTFGFGLSTAYAQIPEKMSYQAVIRDASNNLTTNQAVGMQISILQGSATGNSVYIETQSPMTNTNGLVSLEIGTGTTTDDFSTIDWTAGPYFIKTETDPTTAGGTNYTITGTTQLMSVPYALHAKTAESITGTVNYTETDPVFGASVANGITAIDTANWNNHTVDTDTQIDSIGIAALGYVAEKTYTIGLYPELGGYVFWVSTDGKHGLVAETIDQGISNWHEAQDAISNPNNHSLNGQRYRDWRMPTKYELNEIYSQKIAIGGFTSNNYWSSTEGLLDEAWWQFFSDGSQSISTYITFLYVRSVRAF